MLPNQTLFVTDTHVNENPSAEEIANITIQAADEMLRFGVMPKIALLSHSNFGSRPTGLVAQDGPRPQAGGRARTPGGRWRNARRRRAVGIDPAASLSGQHAEGPRQPAGHANLDTGNITYNMLKMTGSNGIAMGPTATARLGFEAAQRKRRIIPR